MIAQFGGYEVDFDRVEVRNTGTTLAVQPQVFAVIEHLIEHRERVVSKEELLDEVWGDRFVSESALTSRIKSARRALGDSGSQQAIIRTIQGRGYRFVAELSEGLTEDHTAPTSMPTAPATDPAMSEPGSAARFDVDDWPLIGRHRDLERVAQMNVDPSCPGVVVTGPEHIGVSRFALACLTQAAAAGTPTAHIVGLVTASTIPLAVMSHLLPEAVLTTDHLVDDLARADVHRRALSALQDQAAGSRLMVVVENAHNLDSMTSALLTTASMQGIAFVVLVRSQLTEPMGDGLDEGLFREIRLRRLDETDVDILLHRVLGGPIDPSTLRQLVKVCDGRPGLLRDIVETSVLVNALKRDHGVWRLVAAPASSAERAWNPSQFSADAIRAIEVLSLLPHIAESLASELFGIDALDELDEQHLIALEEEDDGTHISLADPLLASVIAESIGALRERRLKQDLAERLLVPGTAPFIIATVAEWVLAGGDDVDHSLLLTAAQTAMIVGDLATAGLLVDLIQDRNDPAVQLVDAEVSLRRSQWDRAESLFESIDVSSLDDISMAHALRRRAAIQFYSKSRHEETIEWLAHEAKRQGGRAARALEARRVGMLAFLGRVDDTLDAAAELGELRGLTAIEVLLSTGSAYLHRGTFDQTLEMMDAVDRLIDDVPEAWADEPRDGVLTVRGSGLLHLGRVEEAAALMRTGLPLGQRTALGYLPSLAAEIELAAGRPRAAREVVRQAVESSHRDEFPQYRQVAEAVYALTDVALGFTDDAARRLGRARSARAELTGELDWKVSVMIAQLAAALGEPDDPGALFDLADEAKHVGAFMREAELKAEAALHDQSRTTARDVADRVHELVDEFDGDYWPIRAAHVTALARGEGLNDVWAAYDNMGFHGHTPRK